MNPFVGMLIIIFLLIALAGAIYMYIVLQRVQKQLEELIKKIEEKLK